MNKNSTINWYPGHMAKASKEIGNRIKVVDMIIELVDARAPYSSKNPMLDRLSNNKPRLVVLTKKDMADDNKTKEWIQYYKTLGYSCISVNLKQFKDYNRIISECHNILKDKREKDLKKGLRLRPIRAMIVGIPNVGKSTFINALSNKKVTTVGNKPGVTKAQQLIKVDKDFELFDTPGILWPKFKDNRTAFSIAMIGSIKQSVLPLDDLFIDAIKYLNNNYPELLLKRYNLSFDCEDDWLLPVFDHISKIRGIKKINDETDYERVIELFFNDLYSGNIGKITWEDISCVKD